MWCWGGMYWPLWSALYWPLVTKVRALHSTSTLVPADRICKGCTLSVSLLLASLSPTERPLLNNFYNYPMASDEHIRVPGLAWGVLKSMQTALLASWIMVRFWKPHSLRPSPDPLSMVSPFPIVYHFSPHIAIGGHWCSYWSLPALVIGLLILECFAFCPFAFHLYADALARSKLWVLPFPAVCQALTPPPLWLILDGSAIGVCEKVPDSSIYKKTPKSENELLFQQAGKRLFFQQIHCCAGFCLLNT